jgi:hypothetical protein
METARRIPTVNIALPSLCGCREIMGKLYGIRARESVGGCRRIYVGEERQRFVAANRDKS